MGVTAENSTEARTMRMAVQIETITTVAAQGPFGTPDESTMSLPRSPPPSLLLVIDRLPKRNDPVELWKSKPTPFDPNRNLLSAVVLVRKRYGRYRLFVVAKGALELTKNMMFVQDGEEQETGRRKNRRKG